MIDRDPVVSFERLQSMRGCLSSVGARDLQCRTGAYGVCFSCFRRRWFRRQKLWCASVVQTEHGQVPAAQAASFCARWCCLRSRLWVGFGGRAGASHRRLKAPQPLRPCQRKTAPWSSRPQIPRAAALSPWCWCRSRRGLRRRQSPRPLLSSRLNRPAQSLPRQQSIGRIWRQQSVQQSRPSTSASSPLKRR